MDAGPGPGSLSTASRNANEPLDWHFLQCFGERTPGEEIQDGRHLGNVRRAQRIVAASSLGPAPATSFSLAYGHTAAPVSSVDLAANHVTWVHAA